MKDGGGVNLQHVSIAKALHILKAHSHYVKTFCSHL
jgi:hypothetical protein